VQVTPLRRTFTTFYLSDCTSCCQQEASFSQNPSVLNCRCRL